MPQQLNGGSFDRRIVIQRMTVTPSAYNEPVESWATHLTLWARKVDTSAGEGRAAAEVGASLSARFTVRWSNDTHGITAKDRLTFDGKTYNITGVRDIGMRHTFIEIDTAVRTDQGVTIAPPIIIPPVDPGVIDGQLDFSVSTNSGLIAAIAA